MTDLEIREQIASYLAGSVDARTLEDCLQDGAWDATGETVPLAADALRLLAEHSNDDWTDEELREQLGVLSRTYWLQHAPKVVYADSDAHVIREDRQSASAGRWRVAESV